MAEKKLMFADVKEDILTALNKVRTEAGITETVGLVDGFINSSLHTEVTDSIIIGGPIVPMIMLVGKNTGRIYLFALNILLPGRV